MNLLSPAQQERWRALVVAAGPHVVSMRIWLALAPLGVPGLLTFLRTAGGDELLTGATSSYISTVWAVATLAYLVGGLVMALGSITVLRQRATRPVSLVVVLAVWSVAGFVTTPLTWWGIHAFHPTGGNAALSAQDALRYTITYDLKMAFCVATVGVITAQRRQIRTLLESITHRRDLLDGTAHHLEMVRLHYREMLNKALSPRIAALQAEVRALHEEDLRPDEARRLADRIQRFASGEVRSISHLLASTQGSARLDLSARSTAPEVRGKREFVLGFLSYSAQPLPAALVLLVLRMSWNLGSTTAESFALIVGPVLSTYGTLLLGRAAMARARRHGYRWRVVVTMGTYLIAISAALALNALDVSDLAIAPIPLGQILTLGQMLLVMGGMSILTYSVESHRRTARLLMRVNDRVTALLASLDLETRRMRESLALIIHGPIQGRLALVSLSLRQLADAHGTPGLDSAVLMDRIEQLLNAAESELENLLMPTLFDLSLEQSLTQEAALWNGVLTLRWKISDSAADKIASDPRLQRNTIEIISQAVANARGHGGARLVEVEVDMAIHKSGLLEIRVLDDGTGPPAKLTSGLGSDFLDSLGADWRLTRTPEGKTELFVALEPTPRTPRSRQHVPA